MKLIFPNCPAITLDMESMEIIAILQDRLGGDTIPFIDAIDHALTVLNSQSEDYEKCTEAIRELITLRSYIKSISTAEDFPATVVDLAAIPPTIINLDTTSPKFPNLNQE